MPNYQDNKWGLVYDGAIGDNEPGQVELRQVRYASCGVEAAANLYLPAGYDPAAGPAYAAITVAHPNGGTKEQVAGMYAQKLAEAGYVAIAADAAFQGESAGEPHGLDLPANRIEDIRRMHDYLAALPGVDPDRIGALGICGGGGYTLGAAQSDTRIAACATLSMFNSGRVRRLGYGDSQADSVRERLADANAARAALRAGGEAELVGGFPPMTHEQMLAYAETIRDQPSSLYRDGFFYYGIDYFHPRATGTYTKDSLVDLMMWDAEDRMDLIACPLLMIAGTAADSLYMTEDAYALATGTNDKELHRIEGASHIQTYFVPEYVEQVTAKLLEFFGRTL